MYYSYKQKLWRILSFHSYLEKKAIAPASPSCASFLPCYIGGECRHLPRGYEHPAEAVGPPGIEDLVRHLAEVADRKQQLTEQLVVSQARHAEDLVHLRAETAARVPLLEPRATTYQLLTELTSQDDLEAYLHTFEVVARREGCDQAEWAQLLAPLLTGEAHTCLQLTVCCIRK